MDVNGAFSLMLSPQALPGKCGQCGKAKDDKGFIDTGLQYEEWGALIFCSECVLDMASKYGLASMDQVAAMRNRIAELETETVAQREAILWLESAVDGLQAARSSGYSGNGHSTSALSENEELSPVTEQRKELVEDSESGITSGEPTPGELIGEQGSDGVSSNIAELTELNF